MPSQASRRSIQTPASNPNPLHKLGSCNTKSKPFLEALAFQLSRSVHVHDWRRHWARWWETYGAELKEVGDPRLADACSLKRARGPGPSAFGGTRRAGGRWELVGSRSRASGGGMVLLYERMSGRGQGNRDVREIDEATCNETRWTMEKATIQAWAPLSSSTSHRSQYTLRCTAGSGTRYDRGASRTRSDTVVDWRAGVLGGTRRAPKNGLGLTALDIRERGQEPPTLALTAVKGSKTEPPTLALTAVVTHCGNVVWRTSVGRLRRAQDRTLSRAQQVVRPGSACSIPVLKKPRQEPPTLALTAVVTHCGNIVWRTSVGRLRRAQDRTLSRAQQWSDAVLKKPRQEPPTLALTAVVTHCGNIVWRTSVGRLRRAQDRTLSRAQQVVRPGATKIKHDLYRIGPRRHACISVNPQVERFRKATYEWISSRDLTSSLRLEPRQEPPTLALTAVVTHCGNVVWRTSIEPRQEHSKWSDAGLLKNDPYYFGSDSRPKTNGTKTLKLGRDQSQCKSEAKCENVYHVFQRQLATSCRRTSRRHSIQAETSSPKRQLSQTRPFEFPLTKMHRIDYYLPGRYSIPRGQSLHCRVPNSCAPASYFHLAHISSHPRPLEVQASVTEFFTVNDGPHSGLVLAWKSHTLCPDHRRRPYPRHPYANRSGVTASSHQWRIILSVDPTAAAMVAQ
ncbi:hypothetical protein B0H12DRAFT_1079754 [Mycena haematopus]|nr:hypothetical protein B0H12DRAFT_1079754 [Mycena haematopus]